ncbi:MAG: CYTH and CHAD domain-containing protein [Pseudomonadota bacterium]
MANEIEVKLAVTGTALERLRRSPLLRTLASGRRARRVELESTYFDTPDLDLKAEGMALRVRKQGNRRIQTVKLAKSSSLVSLREVRELEADVSGDNLDLLAIEDPAIRDWLVADGVAERLGPVFTTRITRHILPLRLIESEIEVAFDEGVVIAGKLQEPLCEVELELLSGAPDYLLQLAIAIGEQTEFQLETRSKAARGYSLVKPQVVEPFFAQRGGLGGTTTAGGAFERIAHECLEQIRGNEAALLSGYRGSEAVHQFRVGVRRLRAALSLFRPLVASGVDVQLSDDLKWLQNTFGPARDWDVFREETLALLRHRLPQEEGLALLSVQADGMGLKAYDSALSVLRSHRYAMLILRLEYWLRNGAWHSSEPGQVAQPVGDFAAAALARRAKQVLKRGKEQNPEEEETLHALRIAGKKLRYALEFFRDVLNEKGAKEAIGLSKRLQDCLGSLNDAAVSRGLIDSLIAETPDKVDARALGLVLGWQAHRVEEDLGHLDGVWAEAQPLLKAVKSGKL